MHAQERKDGDPPENVRNVIQMLAPLLVAHAGRGPRAVELGSPVATSEPAAAAADERQEFTARAPQHSVAAFLAAHVDHYAGEHTHLKYGMFQVGKLILCAVCAEYGAQQSARMPKDLMVAVLRIDAGVRLQLPAACHLYLAELCLERGFDTLPTSTGKAREVRPKRGRGAEVARMQAQRIGLAESRARREAEALLARADAHLADCLAALRRGGGTLAAASGAAGPRALVARLHWAAHRLQWHHGNAIAAHEHIERCARAVLGIELLVPAAPPLPLMAGEADPAPLSLALPHCPSAPLIDAPSLKRAGRRLQLHKVLEDLPGEIARRGHRAVFTSLAPDLLPTNAGAVARLFASPKAYVIALQQVLAALDPALVEPADAPGEVAAREGDGGAADGEAEAAAPARVRADLSQRDILSLRMSCSLCCLQVALPLEPSIKQHSKLVVDGRVSETIALVRRLSPASVPPSPPARPCRCVQVT